MIVQLLRSHGASGSFGASGASGLESTAVYRCGQHVCPWANKPEMVASILGEYRAGRSVRWIAARYPYARDTVTRILDAHGVPRRSRSEQGVRVVVDLGEVDRRHRLERESLNAIAAECGLSRQGLSRRLRRYRNESTAADRATA